MTITEKAKTLRKELKSLGYTAKQISVTTKDYSSIRVKIKDVSIYLKDIETLANTYECVSRDAGTGEILGGGNDYVFTSYDYEALKTAKSFKMDDAQKILNSCENSGYVYKANEEYSIIYYNKDGYLPKIVCTKDNTNYDEITCIAHNQHDIAEALVRIDSFIAKQ